MVLLKDFERSLYDLIRAWLPIYQNHQLGTFLHKTVTVVHNWSGWVYPGIQDFSPRRYGYDLVRP